MPATNEQFRAMQDRSAKRKLLLMSAVRYVEGYAENEGNHPQARDAARDLVRQIKEAIS